ncbi:Retrovirus-related Pol polyprotein from transposon TNT 1-94, partial [Bienertia sinuspersici]
TWDRLKAIFQDNKHTRAVYLENQFNSLHLSNFFYCSSYCQQLKSLKDQLANVDHKISDQKLVLRLVAGLINTDYDTVAAMISQSDPLPDFETARSKLLLEETRKANDISPSTNSFLTQTQDSPSPQQPTPAPSQQTNNGRTAALDIEAGAVAGLAVMVVGVVAMDVAEDEAPTITDMHPTLNSFTPTLTGPAHPRLLLIHGLSYNLFCSNSGPPRLLLTLLLHNNLQDVVFWALLHAQLKPSRLIQPDNLTSAHP